jgi:hypothetical protein
MMLAVALAGEGSRPRDPFLLKSSAFDDRVQKYSVGLKRVLAPRGDVRPPGIAPLGRSMTLMLSR